MKILGGEGLEGTLAQVKSYPRMFLLDETVRSLLQFLLGWSSHRSFTPDNDYYADCFFANFDSFIIWRLNLSPTTEGWAVIIGNHCADQAQLEFFFELLEDFIESDFFINKRK